ncbi:MAG: hypothetical protein IJ069_02530 [Prevotella sp.]|nr:hypothetical protein [Prevotella sp.]
MKKLFTLLTLALISIGSAWGTDIVWTFRAADLKSPATSFESRSTNTFVASDGTSELIVKGNSDSDVLSDVSGTDATVAEVTYSSELILNGKTESAKRYIKLPRLSGPGTLTVVSGKSKSSQNIFVGTEEGSGGTQIGTGKATLKTAHSLFFVNLDDTKDYYINIAGGYSLYSVIWSPTTLSSTTVTKIKVNGSDTDLTLTGNAVTDVSAYTTIPTVTFVYNAEFANGKTENDLEDEVKAVKDGDNYVATSTSLKTTATVTFTNVNIAKIVPGLEYASSTITKKIAGLKFTNALTNPHSLTISYTITDNGTGSTINASTGEVTVGSAVGSETVTASFAGDEEYEAGSATFTLTVAAATAQTQVSAATTWTWDNITPGDQIEYAPKPSSIILADEDRLDFTSLEGDASAIKLTDPQRPMMTSNSRQCAQSGGFTIEVTKAGLLTVEYSGNNTNSRDVFINGTKADSYNNSSIRTIEDFVVAEGTVTFEFKQNDEGTLGRIYSINFTPLPATVSVPVGTTGWSTYSSAYALDFENAQEGIEAYVITGFEGTTLTTSKITGTVAANTGLLVKGTASTNYNVPVVATGDAPTANLLIASVAGETVDAGTGDNVNYVLVNNSGTAEFQWIDDTSAILGANKAYLQIVNGPTSETSAHGLTIDLDGELTGIKNIKVGSEDNIYYDLQGHRVLYPTKGLYIVNGKKVILK